MNPKLEKLIQENNASELAKEMEKIYQENQAHKENIITLINDSLTYTSKSLLPLKVLYELFFNRSGPKFGFFSLLKEKIIEKNDKSLIDSIITLQFFPPKELIISAIRKRNISMMEYLMLEDKFYLSNSDKYSIHTFTYSQPNAQMTEKVEALLSQINYPFKFEDEGLYQLLSFVIHSNNPEYINRLKNKFNVNFQNIKQSVENIFSLVLTQGFLDTSTLNQCFFIEELIKIEKSSEIISLQYFTQLILNKKDKSLFSDVLDYLLNKKLLTEESLLNVKNYLSATEKEEYFSYYDIRKEQQELNKRISSTILNSQKIKL